MLNASFCFISINLPQLYNFTMTGRTISSEPSVDWYRRIDAENKTRIFRQLDVGVRPQDTEERGILDLEIRSRVITYMQREKESGVSMFDSFLNHVMSEYITRNGWSMRFDDFSDPWTSLHPAHASVFQAILQKTQDPALAVQSLVFRFFQMTYYNWQQNFDLFHTVDYTLDRDAHSSAVDGTGYSSLFGLFASGSGSSGDFALCASDKHIFAGECVAGDCADGFAPDGRG